MSQSQAQPQSQRSPSSASAQAAFVSVSPATIPRTGSSQNRHGRCTMTAGRQERPRVETMVHSRQVGYSTLEDMQHFLRHEPREKRDEAKQASPSTGSGKKRSRARDVIERADCYVEPDGHQVIISPGFF